MCNPPGLVSLLGHPGHVPEGMTKESGNFVIVTGTFAVGQSCVNYKQRSWQVKKILNTAVCFGT
jgi:hypothetical protein